MPLGASKAGFLGAAGSGGSSSLSGYYGPEYSGFSAPIVIDSSSYDEWTGTSSNTHNSLSFFIDHNAAQIWGCYGTASYYSWPNGGSNYSGAASFYQTSGGQVNLSGHSGSGIGANGRGCTIAYLNDGPRTPVICISDYSAGYVYFYLVSSGNYLGKALVSASMTSHDKAGMVWNGEHLVIVNRAIAIAYVFEVPSSTSIPSSLVHDRSFNVPHQVSYGMAWTGDSYILSDANNTATASEFTENAGSYTLVGAANKFNLGATSYSLAMDFRNSKLVMGGYSNNKHRVWSV